MDKRFDDLYKADQRDRHRLKLGDLKKWKRLEERDKERQQEVIKILKENKNLDAFDYFRAAMIFYHSTIKAIQRKAAPLAKKAMDMGHVRSKWLYAAAVDRALVEAGKKQKFGTQFVVSEGGVVKSYPIEKSTTDELRAKYNVAPIEVRKKQIEKYWKGK